MFISNSGSFGASSNTIGGTSAAARNVVSANASYGVFIYSATKNLVEGDYVGTNAAGTAALGNNEVGFGVYIQNATGNTVGGTVAGSGNVISGNTASGVDLGASSANVIEGNFIGTDHTGEKPLGNAGSGVYALQSSANTIGGRPPAPATSSPLTAVRASNCIAHQTTSSKEIISALMPPARPRIPAPTVWVTKATVC